MRWVADGLIGVVALIHAYIVLLEMVLWTGPRGQRAFGTTPEFARQTATLAANQGLYNGFLVAGLVVALIAADPIGYAFAVFTLSCVVVAGVYGAATASRRILWVQAVPAALALIATLMAG